LDFHHTPTNVPHHIERRSISSPHLALAFDLGFYDQSLFGRRFRTVSGPTTELMSHAYGFDSSTLMQGF
jgi:hypothetical protein